MTLDEIIVANAYRMPSQVTPYHAQLMADHMAHRSYNEGHRPHVICNSRLTEAAQADRINVISDRLMRVLIDGDASMSELRQRMQVHSDDISAALEKLMIAGKITSFDVHSGTKNHRVMYGVKDGSA